MDEFRLVMGYLGGVVCSVGVVIYIIAIIRHKVVSNRVTWAVWVLVTAMIAFGYTEATNHAASIWVNIVYFFGTFLTFVFLLFYGKPGKWGWVESVCFSFAIILAIVWYLTNLNPIEGLTFTLAIDALGGIILVKSVYLNPDSEYGAGWYVGFSANLINIFAVPVWNWQNAAQPIYMLLLTGTISILILYPKFLRSSSKIFSCEKNFSKNESIV